MRISDLMDLIEDDTVPIEEKELIPPERISELTLQKLHKEQAEKRRRSRKAAVIVLIAAVLAALSVTAYATGLLSRLVNWQGRTVETEDEVMATVPPDAEMIGNETRDAAVASILAQREDRELVIVRFGGSAASIDRTAPVASVGELRELLAQEYVSFSIPAEIPADYTLVMGRVSYESAPGYGYTLVSAETREDGLVVEHYSAPAEGDFISGYTLEWENDAGQRISLRAHLMQDTEDMDFGVWGDSVVYHLTADGMDDALGIQSGSSSTVWMRQRLASPVYCVNRFALLDADSGISEPLPDEERQDVVYEIYAQGLTVEDLQALLIS